MRNRTNLKRLTVVLMGTILLFGAAAIFEHRAAVYGQGTPAWPKESGQEVSGCLWG